jgi:hypothetical protein
VTPSTRVLIVLVVVNALVGALAFGLHAPGIVAEATATPVRVLPDQVRQLQDRIKQGHHGEPYQLALSDADLTALANYVVSGSSDIPFRDIRIAVVGNEVVADGVTKGMAFTLPVRVRGVLTARAGLPAARVDDVSLGDVAIPEFVRAETLRRVNSSLDFTRYRFPVTVDAIETQNGSLTIKGKIK